MKLVSPFVFIGRWYDEQNFLSTVSFQIFISSNKFGSVSTLPHNLLSTAVSSFDPQSRRKLEIVELGCRLLNLLTIKMNSPQRQKLCSW